MERGRSRTCGVIRMKKTLGYAVLVILLFAASFALNVRHKRIVLEKQKVELENELRRLLQEEKALRDSAPPTQ
jgi:hypothetical protein